MSKKLYVGNLDWNVTDDELKNKFAELGSIEEAVVIKDKMSGRSKGFGFVTFSSDKDADAAIESLNGKELNGRPMTVNEARPLRDR